MQLTLSLVSNGKIPLSTDGLLILSCAIKFRASALTAGLLDESSFIFERSNEVNSSFCESDKTLRVLRSLMTSHTCPNEDESTVCNTLTVSIRKRESVFVSCTVEVKPYLIHW